MKSLVAVVVVALARAAVAAPDELAAARDALEALRYDDALRLLERAWHRGDNGPRELRAIFALAGEAAGTIGDDAAARLWFSRWLCLEPSAELPAGSSPKLTALLGDARRALAGAALTARAVRRADRVDVAITGDPLALAVAVRIGDARAPIAGNAARLPPAPGDVELLDRSGNVLAAIATEQVVAAVPIVAPPPHRASWKPWAVATGVLAVAGGVALGVAIDARSSLASLDATSASHEYASEAHPLEDRLAAAQWTARIAFGGAIVVGVVTAIAWWRGHRSIAPARDGGALAWRF